MCFGFLVCFNFSCTAVDSGGSGLPWGSRTDTASARALFFVTYLRVRKDRDPKQKNETKPNQYKRNHVGLTKINNNKNPQPQRFV